MDTYTFVSFGNCARAGKTSGSHYEINSSFWLNSYGGFLENYTFISNTKYQGLIYLQAEEGYAFSSNTTPHAEITSLVSLKVNGSQPLGVFNTSSANVIAVYTGLYTTVVRQNITRIEISLDPPPYGDVYHEADGSGFYREDANNTGAFLQSGEVNLYESYWYNEWGIGPGPFTAGKYFADMYFTAKPGYKFPDDKAQLKVVVNGVTYDPNEEWDYSILESNYLRVSTINHPSTLVDVSQVNVWLPFPTAGGAHKFVSGGNGADARVDQVTSEGAWIAEANWYDDSLSDPKAFTTFQAGKTYRLDLAVYGEEFTYNQTSYGFPEGTKFTINDTPNSASVTNPTKRVWLDYYYYTVPGAVPVIKSIANTVNGVQLTWVGSEGAAKYAIYRKAQGESKYTRISISTGTSYTDKSAVDGTYYYYRIWSMDSSNKVLDEWSNARGITCNRTK